jgi:hypothetical protein
MLTRLIPFTERLVQLTIKGFIRSGSWRPLWAPSIQAGAMRYPSAGPAPGTEQAGRIEAASLIISHQHDGF